MVPRAHPWSMDNVRYQSRLPLFCLHPSLKPTYVPGQSTQTHFECAETRADPRVSVSDGPLCANTASSKGGSGLLQTFGHGASRRQKPTLIAINITTANEHLGRRVDDNNKARCPRIHCNPL